MLKFKDKFLHNGAAAIQLEDGSIFEFSKETRKKSSKVHGIGINDVQFSVNCRCLAGKKVSWPPAVVWNSMLRRCYSSYTQNRNPAYKGVTCCPEWHYLTNFLDWMLEQPYVEGFQLDKDILGDGTVYCPSTCLFVPRWVNNLILDGGASKGYRPPGVSTNRGRPVASVCMNGKQSILKQHKKHPSGTTTQNLNISNH